MPTPLEIARGYAELGLAPFALPYGQKRAVRCWERWQDVPPTQRELEAMFDGDEQNIAIISGRAGGGLLVLDADNERTFTEVAARLRADGIETWVVQRPANGSAHDGGGHFYLRTPRAVKSARIGSALEIKAQGKYVLAPPSLHPQGGLYRFVKRPPVIFTLPSLDALPWLGLEPAELPRPGMPRLALRLLAGDPDYVGRYDTRSEAEAAVCCALANAGFTFGQALALFESWTGPGKFRELAEKRQESARRYFALSWRNATAFVRDNPSPHKQLAQRLKAWALSRPWPGRTGANDRAIYLAHCTIVERCAQQPYGASARELAELAGVSSGTAARANHRLIDKQRLAVVQKGTPSYPARYTLLDVASEEIQNVALRYNPSRQPVRDCVTMLHSHDAFRRGGLNKSGAEVLMALAKAEEEIATVRELAEATGRHRTTIYRKLKGDPKKGVIGLYQLGLVEPVGRGVWRLVPEFDTVMLDQAAADLNTAGVGRRQRERHRQERYSNRRKLE